MPVAQIQVHCTGYKFVTYGVTNSVPSTNSAASLAANWTMRGLSPTEKILKKNIDPLGNVV